MMLQAIQHGRPEKRWVLKGFHGPRLAALFDAYPDARVIYCHRDPVQVTASRIQMAVTLHEGLTGRADPDAVAQQAKIHLAASRSGFHSILENPFVDDPRVMHVRYTDFVADQVGVIRSFYEFADTEWTDEGEAAMRHYLATNKGDRYGKFRYSTDIIGEDVDALNEEFAPYRERFDIEIEQQGLIVHPRLSVDQLCFPGAPIDEFVDGVPRPRACTTSCSPAPSSWPTVVPRRRSPPCVTAPGWRRSTTRSPSTPTSSTTRARRPRTWPG